MKSKVYVPPIKIQGIKTKLVPIIKENVLISDNTYWIEPFMGSGVVGFNVAPKNAIFADSNPHIIEFYRNIQSGIITSGIVRAYLEREGKFLEDKDDEYYYLVRERFNQYHESLDFLFLNRSCFNGMIRFNKEYRFNVPYGHKPYRFSKAYITKIVNQVEYISNLMRNKNWTFLCSSFEKVICSAPNSSFIYCDPPYIGRNVDYYDSWSEKDEISLKENLFKGNYLFMLSTWDHNRYRKNEYIDRIWRDCYKINIEHYYHIGAKEENRNSVTEALLMNYDFRLIPKHFSKEGEQLSFIFE